MPLPLSRFRAGCRRLLLFAGIAAAPIAALAAEDPAQPVLSEFLAINESGLQTADGDRPDWIEIHLAGGEMLDLAGYLLQAGSASWAFPSQQLAPGAFLIVFASGVAYPESRDPAGALHATFRLASEGEDLRLLAPDGSLLSAFENPPPQYPDVAFGKPMGDDAAAAYLSPPSPGAANSTGYQGLTADTRFSVDRGFFDAPFEVEITSATPGAVIDYTLDGSDPSKANVFRPAHRYTGPIRIETTGILRARATRPGFLPTNTDTQTYLFPGSIIRQPAAPEGFPTTWGVFTGVNGGVAGRPVPADYEVKPALVNADPQGMMDSLRSLPTLSIAGDPEDLFGVNGILQNPFGPVDGSGVHNMNPFVQDRPVSIEWIDPQDGPEIQTDCGIRINGGWSRHYIATPKKSFTLLFRSEFGPRRLQFPLFPGSPVQSFDRIILKGIFSNAWPDAARPPDYLRDQFLRDTMLAMGQPSSRGTWAHVYLNGLYWGIYNPSERPDASFAASHFGGDKEDYDAIKHAGLARPGVAINDQFEVIDGDGSAWREALALARDGLVSPDAYGRFSALVDIDNLIDYMLVNFYSANVDWPHKNWYANRLRVPGAGFRFYCWDGEYAWHDTGANLTGAANSNTPAYLYSRARQLPEFRMRFADRTHRSLFNDGAVQPDLNIARYRALADRLEPAIPAEAARWGDNGVTRQGPTNYTFSNWVNARDGILETFLPQRHEIVLGQLRAAGLYPAVEAPVFGQHGGAVEAGFSLTMRSRDARSVLKPEGGDIYYTLDGSDPRLPGNLLNEASARRYTAPLRLESSATVRARLLVPSLFNQGTWSALTEARFIAGGVPASRENLVLTEIHYHPAAPSPSERAAGHEQSSAFEFLELYNPSLFNVDLSGVRFSDGIAFAFPVDARLPAGQRLVLVQNEAAFSLRYGSGIPVFGEFESGRLDDSGERLALDDRNGQPIFSIEYGDDFPWPEQADGDGPSLSLRYQPGSTSDPAQAEQWRPSRDRGGSPGTTDGETLAEWMDARGIADPLADPDGDGLSHFFIYATGADLTGEKPGTRESPIAIATRPAADGMFELRLRTRLTADDLLFQPEHSTDLGSWSPASHDLVQTASPGDGSALLTFRGSIPADAAHGSFYWRFRILLAADPPN